jgi:hypothetical protein
MQNKKSNKTNLRFFSHSASKQLETELDNLIESVRSGKTSLKDAFQTMEKAYVGKIGHFDHISPEIFYFFKLLVIKHLILEMGGQLIPSCDGHPLRFFHSF